MHYTVSVCLLLYKIRFYPLKNFRPKIVVSYNKKMEKKKSRFQKEVNQIRRVISELHCPLFENVF